MSDFDMQSDISGFYVVKVPLKKYQLLQKAMKFYNKEMADRLFHQEQMRGLAQSQRAQLPGGWRHGLLLNDLSPGLLKAMGY